MLTMLEKDRRTLTAGLLRVLKASASLSGACLAPARSESSWVATMTSSAVNGKLLWDGNVPFRVVRASIARTAEAAREHGAALFELARSARALSVPLATVTRGAIEAYGRIFYLLSADAPDALFARYAALDYFDMDYPQKQGAKLRRLPLETEATHPVDAYRERIRAWADASGLKLNKQGPAVLAGDLLMQLYPDGVEAKVVYSGLSAAAHAQPWATANFYDFEENRLRRDDEMLMEYCVYVIETTRLIDDQIVQRFGAERADIDRWKQANAHVSESLSSFVRPTT